MKGLAICFPTRKQKQTSLSQHVAQPPRIRPPHGPRAPLSGIRAPSDIHKLKVTDILPEGQGGQTPCWLALQSARWGSLTHQPCPCLAPCPRPTARSVCEALPNLVLCVDILGYGPGLSTQALLRTCILSPALPNSPASSHPRPTPCFPHVLIHILSQSPAIFHGGCLSASPAPAAPPSSTLNTLVTKE